MNSSIRALVVVAALATAGQARAEAFAGAILGDVVDGDEVAPLAGVIVTARSPALMGEERAITDDEGRYRIGQLPPGTYQITFAKDGFGTERVVDIELRSNATLRVDGALFVPPPPAAAGKAGPAASAAGPAIRVVAGAPTIDVGSSQVGTHVDEDLVRRVPIAAAGAKGGAARSFENVAAVAPGARADTYGASVAGATSPENHYVIDGQSVNNTGFGVNGTPLTLEFVDQVEVIQGGYMPEHGRSTGGVFHVVTKSGLNELKASVWSFVSPGLLEGERRLVDTEGSIIVTRQRLDMAGDIGFTLGGPIIHDRLWYFVGGQISRTSFELDRRLIDDDRRQLGPSRRYLAEQVGLQGFGKLTWKVLDGQKLSLSFLATPSRSGGDGSFGIDPMSGEPETVDLAGSYEALAHQYRSGGTDLLASWTSEFLEKRLILETTAGWHHEIGGIYGSDGSAIGDDEGLASLAHVLWRRSDPGYHPITDFEDLAGVEGCEPAGTMSAERCPVKTFRTGGPGFLSVQSFDSFQGKTMGTALFDALGLHIVKLGVDGNLALYENKRGYSGGRVFREGVSGQTFSDYRQFGYLERPDQPVLLDDLAWRTTSVTTGAFLQDSWSAFDVVTLNVGVRYDAQLLFAGDGSLALALPHQISPRAGAVWDVLGNGMAKVYGNYARFFQSVPLDIADRAGSSEPQVTSVRPASACDPRVPADQQGRCLDDDSRVVLNGSESPNKKWIVTGGGRTPIDPAIMAPSTDELVAGGELEVFDDLRTGAVYTKRWINAAIEDMSRDEASTYFIGNPGYGIAEDFAKATRDYDAVTVYATKRWSDLWLFSGSYTWSYLRGNYAGLFRPETGQLDPNINSDFDLRSLTVNRTGPLPGDRTHSIKLFGARDLPAGYGMLFTAGGAFRAESGGPTTLWASHPIYGADEVFLVPRGSGTRLPWTFDLDVHGGFTFEPLKGQKVTFTVDVFNALNLQEMTLSDQTWTESDAQPTEGGTIVDVLAGHTLDGESLADAKNPNFGRAVSYQAPRTIRLGLRAEF